MFKCRSLKFICLLTCFIAGGGENSNAIAPEPSNETACRFLQRDSTFSLCSRKGYIPMLLHNFGEQFLSPVHANASDLIWTVGVASATAFLFYYDFQIDEGIRTARDKSKLVRGISPVITEFGNSYAIGLVGVCGLAGLAGKNHKLFQTSLLASQAAITSGVWVRLVKYCTSRERPSASYTYPAHKGHQGGYWYGFFKQYDTSITSIGRDISYFDAFPSGHTSTAFAIATVFAMQYSDSKAIPIIAYSMAGLVGITRMVEHTHWASDVFVGAWAGYLCAKQVTLHHRKIYGSGNSSPVAQNKKPEIYFSSADNFPGFKLKVIY